MHLAYPRGGGRAMIGAYRKDEVVRLVGAMCDGTITSDDTGQLDALLTKNEEARRFYNNYMFLHAELYSQHAAGPIANLGLRVVDSNAPNPKSEIRTPKYARWLAIAAALFGVAAVSSW